MEGRGRKGLMGEVTVSFLEIVGTSDLKIGMCKEGEGIL